ncbi:MAG: SH3 domain-containing protein [Myxococcota bacterium]
MVITLAFVLLAAETLSYSGPEVRKGASADAFRVSDWTAGQTLYAVSPDINLRAKPSVASPVLAKLSMGAPVVVAGEPGALEIAAGRSDHWYPVTAAGRKGFLHGSTLTPFRWVSAKRSATVAWGPNYKILIRLQTDGEVETLSLEPGGQAYVCCGGLIETKWIPASVSGSPMVEVYSTVEACGDEVTYYVDLGGEAPKLVLETSGIHDPPVYSRAKVTFSGSPRAAKVAQLSWNLGEESGAEECKSERVTDHSWDGTRYVPGASTNREITPCPE